MIGIVGAGDHWQVRVVSEALTANGQDHLVIDHNGSAGFSMALGGRHGKFHAQYGTRDLADISALWSASKFLYLWFGATAEWANEYVSGTNWHAAEFNLLRALQVPVLNSVESTNRCQSKIWQLQKASDCGFDIPETLLSNDIGRVLRALDSGPRIVKALGDPHVPVIGDTVGQRAIMTNDLPRALLEARDGEFESYPLFTQAKVEKAHELRIVVVSDDVFAFQIDPRQHRIMNTDYRRGGYAVEYKFVELDQETRARILRLHESFDLFSGSYDFIVDHAGGLIFLEVNPDGMWGYHDNLIDRQISRSFAGHLARAARNA